VEEPLIHPRFMELSCGADRGWVVEAARWVSETGSADALSTVAAVG
jgi:hypothetical protein